ncbi:MAG TPA: hypothetical protein VN875_08595 [Candidatus Binatus sp.]|jgi:hypothetical protein|nr:hypothetical protein [Candidatus Binatus sp.]
MKRLYPGLGALVLLAFFSLSLAAPGYAQTAAATTKPANSSRYDISKEVTLSATVESVPGKSSSARAQEDFVVLQTKLGTVNGKLTPFALNGKGAISIMQGEQIKATGVMTTLEHKQVFVIRVLEVGGRTYQIRSKHGLPREHPAIYGEAATPSKGGQL